MMLLSNIYNIAIVFGLLWNLHSVIDKRMWSNLRKNTNGNKPLGLAIGERRRVIRYFYRRYKLLSYVYFCVIVIALKKFTENPCYNHVKKCTSVFTTNIDQTVVFSECFLMQCTEIHLRWLISIFFVFGNNNKELHYPTTELMYVNMNFFFISPIFKPLTVNWPI